MTDRPLDISGREPIVGSRGEASAYFVRLWSALVAAASSAADQLVLSVNGKTGHVVIDASDVGLGDVENQIADLQNQINNISGGGGGGGGGGSSGLTQPQVLARQSVGF